MEETGQDWNRCEICGLKIPKSILRCARHEKSVILNVKQMTFFVRYGADSFVKKFKIRTRIDLIQEKDYILEQLEAFRLERRRKYHRERYHNIFAKNPEKLRVEGAFMDYFKKEYSELPDNTCLFCPNRTEENEECCDICQRTYDELQRKQRSN